MQCIQNPKIFFQKYCKMNSFVYNQLSTKTCPCLGMFPRSQVSDDIRRVKSGTVTLRKCSTQALQSALTSRIKEDVENLTSTPKSLASINNNMTNESIQQISSPMLLKYCKQLLENFNVIFKPVLVKGEPFLCNEDTELLSKIIKSNEYYGYLSNKDSNLLKQILDVTQLDIKRNQSSKSSESDEESEIQLLQTLFIEEINEFDETELAWEIIEKVLSYRSCDPEPKDASATSLHLAENETFKINSRESLHSATSSGIHQMSSGLMDRKRFRSSVPSDFLEEQVVNTVSKISSTPHFELNFNNKGQEARKTDTDNCTKKALEDDMQESQYVSNIEILFPDDPEYFYNDILNDLDLPSGASSPVAPPSNLSLSPSTQSAQSLTCIQLKASPIVEARLNSQSMFSDTSYKTSEENLYTDPAHRQMVEKVLDAITLKMSQQRDLPMSRSVKEIRLYDIRRQRVEFIANYINIPICAAYNYQIIETKCLCEEYEIQLMTFEDLKKVGKFYKIDFKIPNEIQMEPISLDEITYDPKKLLSMLKPLKKPSVPMKLVEKIRKNFRRYEEVFDEDTKLYSARSESGMDDELYSTRSLITETHEQSLFPDSIREDLSVNYSKTVGILFDTKSYDSQISGRARKSTFIREDSRGDCKECSNEYDFIRLLKKFYTVDPDTITDLCNHLSGFQTRKTTQKSILL